MSDQKAEMRANKERIDALAEEKLGLMQRKGSGFARLTVLAMVLPPSEPLLNLASAKHQGDDCLLALTDRRLLIVQGGLLKRKQEDLPLDRITSVHTQNSITNYKLAISGVGIDVQLEKILPPQRADEFASEMRGRLGRPAQVSIAPAQQGSSAQVSDPQERLAKARSMLEAGLISQADFDEIKQRVVSEM